jgi:hypothetical protein
MPSTPSDALPASTHPPSSSSSSSSSSCRCSMLFNGKQQDAHECLLILLDIIHMDTNGMIQSNPVQKVASKALASPASGQATTPAEDEWSVVDKDEAGEASSSQGCEDDNADVVDMDSVVSTYMRGILRCETVSAPLCCGRFISRCGACGNCCFIFKAHKTNLIAGSLLNWSFSCQRRCVRSVPAWGQTLLGP